MEPRLPAKATGKPSAAVPMQFGMGTLPAAVNGTIGKAQAAESGAMRPRAEHELGDSVKRPPLR